MANSEDRPVAATGAEGAATESEPQQTAGPDAGPVTDVESRNHGSLLRRLSIWFDAAVVLLMVYVAYSALDFRTLAMYLPLTAGVVGAVLACLNIALKFLRPEKVNTGLEQIKQDVPEGMTEPEFLRRLFVASLYYFAWFCGYVLLIWMVGFVPATVVFLAVFLWRESDMGWVGIIISLVLTYGLIAFFSDIMNFRWPSSLFNLQPYLPFF